MLLAPVALAATSAVTTAASEKKMTLAMHQNTSNGAGYRKSLEGWARAGIKDTKSRIRVKSEAIMRQAGVG